MNNYTAANLKDQLEKKLLHNFGVTPENASDELFYKATALVLVDIMRARRSDFRKTVAAEQAKTIYYMSMEFLMGRSLKTSLYNIGLEKEAEAALADWGIKIDRIFDEEPDGRHIIPRIVKRYKIADAVFSVII